MPTRPTRIASILASLIGLVVSIDLLAVAQAPAASSGSTASNRQTIDLGHAAPKVDLMWGQKIPMRDGVKLNATVYRPAGQTAPLPAIVTQTPYTTDEYHGRAMYFAARGYVYVIVDVRGRGNSEGEFGYHADAKTDGPDVINWIARQPWCDGQVAGQGGSYAGTNQWLTASGAPAALKTITPRASAYPGLDVPMRGGIPFTQRMTWITSVTGRTANSSLAQDLTYWVPRFASRLANHIPYRHLDSFSGNPSPLFQKWVEHSTFDSYYDGMLPSPDQYRRIDMPVLSISGFYDGSQIGVLEYYKNHMKLAPQSARDQHHLLLGPWDHGATGNPRPDVGGVKVGDASLININELQLKWFDWVLKGGSKPEFFKDRVAYFLTGANEWRFAPTLDAIPAKPRTFYLGSTAETLTATAPGLLSDRPVSKSKRATYVFDPLAIEKTIAIDTTRPPSGENRDQRSVLALNGDGLVYITEPLAVPLDLAGFPELTFWASMNVPDTDFSVQIQEVESDGSSTLLTETMLRARFRNSLRTPELVPLNKTVEYRIDGFNFFARRVAVGSRIRLVISAPDSIFVQRNYHSGRVVADETDKDARTATISVLQGGKYASRLVLPALEK
jgi:uncharacterized protein